jgi:hypothetical protein
VIGAKVALLLLSGVLVALTNRQYQFTADHRTGTFLMMMGALLMVADTAVGLSQLFRDEAEEGTLPALLTLPLALSRVAAGGVLGLLAGQLPYLGMVVAGFLFAPAALAQDFLEGRVHPLPLTVFHISFVLLLWHVVTVLSLVLPRGAVGLAVVVLAPLYVLMWGLIRDYSGDAGLALGLLCSVIMLGACGWLQITLCNRLTLLASRA